MALAASLCLVGVKHQLRPDLVVKFFRCQKSKRNSCLLQRRALLVRLLCTLRNIYTGGSDLCQSNKHPSNTYYRIQDGY